MFERLEDIKGVIHIAINPRQVHELSSQGWALRAIYDFKQLRVAASSPGSLNEDHTAVEYYYLFEWPGDRFTVPHVYLDDENHLVVKEKTNEEISLEEDLITLAKELGSVKTKKLLGREIIPETEGDKEDEPGTDPS